MIVLRKMVKIIIILFYKEHYSEYKYTNKY